MFSGGKEEVKFSRKGGFKMLNMLWKVFGFVKEEACLDEIKKKELEVPSS